MTPAQTIALRLRLQAVRALNGDPVDVKFLSDVADAFDGAERLDGILAQVVRDAAAWLDEVGDEGGSGD